MTETFCHYWSVPCLVVKRRVTCLRGTLRYIYIRKLSESLLTTFFVNGQHIRQRAELVIQILK